MACCGFRSQHAVPHRYRVPCLSEHGYVVLSIPKDHGILRLEAQAVADVLQSSSFVCMLVVQLEDEGYCARQAEIWVACAQGRHESLDVQRLRNDRDLDDGHLATCNVCKDGISPRNVVLDVLVVPPRNLEPVGSADFRIDEQHARLGEDEGRAVGEAQLLDERQDGGRGQAHAPLDALVAAVDDGAVRVRCGETIEMQLAPEMLAAVELLPRADDDGQLGPYPANVVDGCDRALVNDMLRSEESPVDIASYQVDISSQR